MSWSGELSEKCSGADFDPVSFDPAAFETEAYGLTGSLADKEPWTAELTEKQVWSGNLTVKEP